MANLRMTLHGLRLASCVGFAVTLLCGAAQAQSALPRPTGVGIAQTTSGPVFTAPNGKTLYTLSIDDLSPGESHCTDAVPESTIGFFGATPLIPNPARQSCVELTPPFLAPDGAEPVGQWSIVLRKDGGRQWAYGGKPLYTSSRDRRSGTVLEMPSFASPVATPLAALPFMPAGLQLMRVQEGMVFAIDGQPLYIAPDETGGDFCKGSCAAARTPVIAPEAAANKGKWSTILRSDGRLQWAYEGHALFRSGRQDEPSPVSSGNQGWFSSLLHALANLFSGEPDWQLALYQKAPTLPDAIGLGKVLTGTVYTTREGKTLYYFMCREPTESNQPCDRPGDPALYMSAFCGSPKACADRFSPYAATDADKPSGDWAIEDVAWPPYTHSTGQLGVATSRIRAWTYKGRPLLTYAGDRKPGDMTGHRMGFNPISEMRYLMVPGTKSLDLLVSPER